MTDIIPYSRRVKVLIGPLEEWRGGGNSQYAISLEGDGTQEGFRIKFDVHKHVISTATPTTIEIYNLGRNLRNALCKKSLAKVALYVGWDNTDFTLLFTGSLLFGYSQRQGADIVTTLVSNAAFGAMSRTILSKTFAAGATIKNIVMDIARELPYVNVDTKNVGIDSAKVLGTQGLSSVGAVNTLLDDLSRIYGFSWYIDNGVFYAPMDGQSIIAGKVVIGSDKGNLLQAEPMLSGAMQQSVGATITCLLNPAILPGGTIELKSSLNIDLNKDYIVHNLTHSGDTHGQSWESRIESWIVVN